MGMQEMRSRVMYVIKVQCNKVTKGTRSAAYRCPRTYNSCGSPRFTEVTSGLLLILGHGI